MHAMHYEITLPADYDMDVIRTRVATRGSALDAFPGLGLKAYCMRARGVDGSPVNQYAPFYLWRTAEGMNAFLWGPGFRGIVNDFGRPAVQHWAGLAFHRGAAGNAIAATKRTWRLPADADPAEAIGQALDDLERLRHDPELHSTSLAIDPRNWELVRFSLWRTAPATDDAVLFQVLHLSRPELEDLSEGRHW
jgi:hypothetical protein